MNDTAKAQLNEPITIAEWWRNRQGESVRVQLSTFKEHNLIDIRTWFTGDDGKLKPGKGFACRVRQLPRLLDALTAALDKARELGLLGEEAESGPAVEPPKAEPPKAPRIDFNDDLPF